MKKFFEYFSGTIYSIKQCLLTWKKPKWYPILTFIIGFLMLLAPIQFSFVTVPIETVVNQVPEIKNVFSSLASDLELKNIEIEIKDGRLDTDVEYQIYIEEFTIYLNTNLEEYPEIDTKIEKETDNILVMEDNKFYARQYDRKNNKLLSLSGTFDRVSHFSFKDLNDCKDENQYHAMLGGFLKAIYMSNSIYNLITWSFIIEVFNLVYVLIFGFLLLYINKKGVRDYKLTYGQSFLTLMASLTLPAFISTWVGMINFKWFTITYIILLLIRLFRLSFAQISRNPAYNQLEVEEDPDNFELRL